MQPVWSFRSHLKAPNFFIHPGISSFWKLITIIIIIIIITVIIIIIIIIIIIMTKLCNNHDNSIFCAGLNLF